MSVTRQSGSGVLPFVLLSLIIPGSCTSAVLPAGEAAVGKTDSVVRVLIKRKLPGLLHGEKLMTQPTVVEVNEYSGVVLDNEAHVVAYVGSAWAAFDGTGLAVSVVSAGLKETPARLIGFDERLSLAIVEAKKLAVSPAVCGQLQDEKAVHLLRSSSGDGWSEHPLDLLKVTSQEFEPEVEVRVQFSSELPPKGEEVGSPVFDRSQRFLGFVTQLMGPGLSRSLRTIKVLPAQLARDSLMEVHRRGGTIPAGWLGVVLDSSTEKVLVEKVVNSSPASTAGLQSGDLVLQVGDSTVWSKAQFVRLIRWAGPGSEVGLTVQRAGRRVDATARLAEWPLKGRTVVAWALEVPGVWSVAEAKVPEIEFYPVPLQPAVNLGIVVDPLSPQLAEYFRTPGGKGLLVTSVVQGGPASEFGLRAGDVLVKINGFDLETAADLRKVIESSTDGILSIMFVRDRNVLTQKVSLP